MVSLRVDPGSVSEFHSPDQVKWPAGITGGNGNIPSPHHRVETTLEEQSISSTFFTSSPSGGVQIGGQAECVRAQQQMPEAPRKLSAVLSHRRTRATRQWTSQTPAGRAPCSGRALKRDCIGSSDRVWSQRAPPTKRGRRELNGRRSEDPSQLPYRSDPPVRSCRFASSASSAGACASGARTRILQCQQNGPWFLVPTDSKRSFISSPADQSSRFADWASTCLE